MKLQLIIGRAGSGKSEYCLNQIRDRLRERADGHPLILLVPEQASFLAETALAGTPGLNGTIRAQVLSFRRLAYRVLQETGGAARVPIDDNGKAMLLYRLYRRHASRLELFTRSTDPIGLVERMNELFNEFRRYRIRAEQLAHFVEQTSPLKEGMVGAKLADLQLLYHEYETELSRLYLDTEDSLQRMAEQMADSAYVRDAEIWMDGFHGFTPQEYEAIGELMRHSRKLSVTLCLDREYSAADRPSELDLFYPAAVTSIRLHLLAEEHQIAIEPAVRLDADTLPRFQGRPMLAHLERTYGSYQTKIAYTGPAHAEADESIVLRAAANRRAEVEAAARDMIRLVRERGYRWRDCAVLVRSASDYEDLFATVFADYEIPYFLDGKKHVLTHPLTEFIRSALETITTRWRSDPLFRCMKTGLLVPEDRGVDQDDLDVLENYALAYGIQGNRWTDGQPWMMSARRSLEDEDVAEQDEEEALLLQRIARSREAVVRPLLSLQRALERAHNVRDMAEALYRLLDEVDVPLSLERWSDECIVRGMPERAREHGQLWGSVMDMLDQVVEMMGEESLPIELFAGVIETGLESMKLSRVPPALDRVLIGSMDRTRPGGIHCCYIIGANDGVMPARPAEDGLLTEDEREALHHAGLELAPGARRQLLDESFMLYHALTSASHRLWISYPLADEEGKSLLPSEIIRQLKKLFPSVIEQQVDGEPRASAAAEEQLEHVAHPQPTFSHLAAKLREWRKGDPIAGFWWDVYDWYCHRSEWQDKLRQLRESLFYTNRETYLHPSTSQMLYGRQMRTSVSRMERFAACPFSHFASYGLQLQDRRMYRLEAPDIGQLFHAALSRIAARLEQSGRSWGALSADACREEAKEAVEMLAPRLQSEILLSSRRYRYIARKLEEIIGRTSVVLAEHARRGSFLPIGLELPFGPGSPLPPLSFRLDNGCTMEIVGRIDRVDAAEGPGGALLLRVIDYKSSPTFLRLDEVYYGLSLQMLTYLDVVVTHAVRWLGRQALPAGALYFHVHNPILQTEGAILPEQAEAELFQRYKMRGIVLADSDVVRQMDSTLLKGHSKIIPVALKTDGSFYSSSAVMSAEQWDTLRGSLRHTIRSIGTRITDGEVAIRPYRKGHLTACSYCSYKPICQFDPQLEGNEYNRLAALDKDQLWSQWTANEGGSLA